MAAVRKDCRVTMDTDIKACMNVHKKKGSIMEFREYSSGLYYYDIPVTNKNKDTNDDVSAYYFVENVENNKTVFTGREVEIAVVLSFNPILII